MADAKNYITVLVVDDQTGIRDVVAEFLEAPNVHIIKASNGSEAISIIVSKQVDLVVSDIQMGEIDGYKLLELLKKHGKNPPELVFMTAYADPQRNTAMRAGAGGVIQKPFTQRELLTWLHMSVSERIKPFFARKLRFPVELKVSYGTLPNELKYEGMVLNVSPTGILIGSSHKLPHVGSEIFCSIDAGEGRSLSLRGQVRWSKDLGDERFKEGIGVDISGASPANLQLLHELAQPVVAGDPASKKSR